MSNLFKLAALALFLAAAGASLDARTRNLAPAAPAAPPQNGSLRIVLEEATVEACMACHKGPLSLASYSSEDLLARIVALAEAQQSHPVPVPSMSDEDFAMLAARLAAD